MFKLIILNIVLFTIQTVTAFTEQRIIFPNTDDKSYESSEERNLNFIKDNNGFHSDGKITYRDPEWLQSNFEANEENILNHENIRVNTQRHPNHRPSSHERPNHDHRHNSIERDRNEGVSDNRSKSNNERHRNGNQRRLCEQKYREYMTQIFRDEDTVADGTDDDFNGRVLAGPGEYPHMTAIGFISENQPVDYKCGGSLISDKFVITAAHCTNLTGLRPAKVRIGDLNLLVEERYLEPQIRNIRQIYTHPDYRSNIYYNDIALLELDEEVELTMFVRPIRLWVQTDLPTNKMAYAMGYGATAFGKARTNRLTNMNLTLVPNDVCNTDLPAMPETPSGIISSQVCAKDFLMNRDTCQGDSGGPLQFNLHGRRKRNRKHFHLIGITSYGLFCRSGYPSIYTRVSSFLDWIESVVWKD